MEGSRLSGDATDGGGHCRGGGGVSLVYMIFGSGQRHASIIAVVG
jgi:hypothetical protein